ncbi:hypothetical protein ACFPVY_12500 [Flavobacterium qiangtangense]|uniref:Lipoprotein n=1 Tax=Flavobacterium qiangtangense TaxID=1442595 RepID=A0ABW1PR52_9FLAO
MKKFVTLFILFIAFLFTFSSCDVSDDTTSNYQFQLVAIDSVEVPQYFVLGETKQIKVYYKRPSTCHFYDGFYYEKNANIRTVAVQMAVFDEPNCEILEEEVATATFNFYVSNPDSYIFKFYQGEDATGQNIFAEYEIPVIQ